jgi:alkylation response protein AidB-like acyl-CoA dehydrogenase
VKQALHAETAIVVGIGRAVDAMVEAITIHGGIAVTWEHDLHLYWRRAISVAAQARSVRCDIVWCQSFSEPQAGSDLASLNAKADEVDGGWSECSWPTSTCSASVAQAGR